LSRRSRRSELNAIAQCGGVLVKPWGVICGDDDRAVVVAQQLVNDVMKEPTADEALEAWRRNNTTGLLPKSPSL
jgi:regulator of RNase E activity RraA